MAQMLLVNGKSNRYWINLLRRAAFSLGFSLASIDYRHIEGVSFQNYELIVLDLSVVVNPTVIIRLIHSHNPLARIIVVSSTPHWKQAKEALLAGATDYTKHVDDEAAILDTLQDNLIRKPAIQHNQVYSRR
jgi:DNA-binding NarL/FixJ family response regulator